MSNPYFGKDDAEPDFSGLGLLKQDSTRARSHKEIKEGAELIPNEPGDSSSGILDEARAFVGAEDFDRTQSAVQASELDPGRQAAKPRIEALVRAAEEAWAAENYDRAIEIVNSAPALGAADPELAARVEVMKHRIADRREAVRLAGKARQWMEQGRSVEAHATADPAGEIESASRRQEDEAKVGQGLVQAKSLLLLESFDDAITGLTTLRAECPGFPVVDQWLERAHSQKAMAERTAQMESQVRRVRSLLSSGRHDLAMGALEALVRQFPEAEVSDLVTQAREVKERDAAVTQALEEVGWLLRQDRPDLTVQFMREKAGELGADARFAARLAEVESSLPERDVRRTYIAAAFKCWWAGILGPALAIMSISLTAFGAFYGDRSRAGSALLICSAWVAGLVAACPILAALFDVWKAQRDRYVQEAKRRSRPEIHGQVRNFKPGIRGEVRKGSLRSFVIPLGFEVSVCNHFPVSIKLQELRMYGNAMPKPATFSNICIWQPAPLAGTPAEAPNTHPDMPGGRYLTLTGSAFMTISEQDFGKQVEMAGARVELIDGFGHLHPLDIEPGACISSG